MTQTANSITMEKMNSQIHKQINKQVEDKVTTRIAQLQEQEKDLQDNYLQYTKDLHNLYNEKKCTLKYTLCRRTNIVIRKS